MKHVLLLREKSDINLMSGCFSVVHTVVVVIVVVVVVEVRRDDMSTN